MGTPGALGAEDREGSDAVDPMGVVTENVLPGQEGMGRRQMVRAAGEGQAAPSSPASSRLTGTRSGLARLSTMRTPPRTTRATERGPT